LEQNKLNIPQEYFTQVEASLAATAGSPLKFLAAWKERLVAAREMRENIFENTNIFVNINIYEIASSLRELGYLSSY
jgi:hypothetical protein